MQDTTILIKTFQRPNCLHKLIMSLGNWTGRIIVSDDGNPHVDLSSFPHITHLKHEFDIGLSKGRNLGLDEIKTEFMILMDDDFVCHDSTNFDVFKDILITHNLDILGGILIEPDGTVRQYAHLFHQEGSIVSLKPVDLKLNYTPCHVCLNFFIAKTESIKKIRWDDNLKVAEHTDFFYRCYKAGLRVGETPLVSMSHEPTQSKDYQRYRNRIDQYTNLVYKKHQLTFTSI